MSTYIFRGVSGGKDGLLLPRIGVWRYWRLSMVGRHISTMSHNNTFATLSQDSRRSTILTYIGMCYPPPNGLYPLFRRISPNSCVPSFYVHRLICDLYINPKDITRFNRIAEISGKKTRINALWVSGKTAYVLPSILICRKTGITRGLCQEHQAKTVMKWKKIRVITSYGMQPTHCSFVRGHAVVH